MASPPLDHLAVQLPVNAYYQLIHMLRLTLPPPLTDRAEDLVRRDHAAIARIAGLCPTNAAEADVAAGYVAASEQWKDCLRLARLAETTPEAAARCRAEALSMMRQANSALRLLLRMQDGRARREATAAGCNSAAWTEHWATGLMAEALPQAATQVDPATPEAPASVAVVAMPPAPAAGPERQPSEAAPREAPATPGVIRHGDTAIAAVALQPPPQPAPVEDLEPDLVAEAEQYAAIYPERARLIRAMGRVPDDATFGPPDDDLVQALVAARTPVLAAPDARP